MIKTKSAIPLLLASVAFLGGCASTGGTKNSDITKGKTFSFNQKNLAYTDASQSGFVAIDGNLDAVQVEKGTVTAKETIRFQANVPNGNYTVVIDTNQNYVISESITDTVNYVLKNEDGVEFKDSKDFSKDYFDEKTKLPLIGVNKFIKSGVEFEVAVCDNVLDLTFVYEDKPVTISKISIELQKLEKRERPFLIAMGDSTTALGDKTIGGEANFLSWGAAISNGDVQLPDTIGGFVNCSESGADMITAYNHARVEKMLLNVRPGDYVSINMGINNNKKYSIGGINITNSHSNAVFVPLLQKYYVEAVKQRGGIPFIATITPQGPWPQDTIDKNSIYIKEETEVVQSFGTDLKNYKEFFNLGTGSNYNSGKNYFAGKAYNPGEKIPAHTWINSRHTGVYNILMLYTANSMGIQVVDLGVYGEQYFNINMKEEENFATVHDVYFVDKHHYKAALGVLLANYVLEQVDKMQDGIYAYPYWNYEPVFLSK